MTTRRDFLTFTGASLLAATTRSAHAESYPSRPVTMVVPFSPGGGTDSTIRLLAERFGKLAGQPMIVENRPGGGSMVALNLTRQQKPDGYTLCVMTRSQFVTYWMNGGGGSPNPLEDFDFVCATHGSIFGMLCRAGAPWTSLTALVADAKKRSSPLTVGTIGAGTIHHLTALEFGRVAGIDIVHVPYKGEADSNLALIGEHIDLAVSSGSFIPFVTSGKLRVLGLAQADRLQRYPTWPTFLEQGYPVVMKNTVGIGGPKGMDPQTTKTLADILRRITEDPEFIAGLERLYQPVGFIAPEPYNKLMRSDFQVARQVVDQYKLRF